MREITYREAIHDAISEEMRRDSRVILMGEDVGLFGGLTGVTIGLIDEFGAERVLETPISECGFVGAAVGAALKGMRPILELGLADVILVAMDQIVNTAAKMNYFYNGRASVPLVCRVWSGFRPSGGPQQSQSNEAMFAHVPGLKVVMPSTPYDVKGLLKASIRDDNPVIFFEPKGVYSLEGPVPDEDYVVELGIAEVKREGRDVTVIALGAMVPLALAAADKLAQDISVEVVDPRTIRPLDVATLVKSVKKTGRAVIVHEANTTGGVGGEIAAVLADDAFASLRAPIKRIGAMETPIPVSPALGSAVVPGESNIVDTVRALIQDTSPS
ncbi:MAG: alpha-ketoacid dehydrogenase subunit beta [Alphaproteobacteria bacterium]|nr:alpha-ketoacid dehydrogenase subunit beta [Alphaproteobacteria bacterium]